MKLYHCRYETVKVEMARQGIQLHSRKGEKKSAEWYAKHRKLWDDPEWRALQRTRWLERLPTMNGPATNSPLERLLQGALLKAGISFSTQRGLLGKYAVDILIDQQPVVIKADGNTHLRKRAVDARRDAELAEVGYRVFRFTGRPITTDPDGCIQQVVDACGLAPDAEPRADIRNGRCGPENNKWTGGKTEWTCEVCGTTFKAYPLRGKPGEPKPRRTCSRECAAMRAQTRSQSPESNAKRSEVLRSQWADPAMREIRQAAQAKAAAGAKAHWEARRQAKAAQQAMRQSALQGDL